MGGRPCTMDASIRLGGGGRDSSPYLGIKGRNSQRREPRRRCSTPTEKDAPPTEGVSTRARVTCECRRGRNTTRCARARVTRVATEATLTQGIDCVSDIRRNGARAASSPPALWDDFIPWAPHRCRARATDPRRACWSARREHVRLDLSVPLFASPLAPRPSGPPLASQDLSPFG